MPKNTEEPAWQLAWRDGLSVHNAEVDRDHKELIARVNDLNAALVAQSGRAEVLRLMQILLDSATRHFEREEALLCERGYPGVERHRQSHVRLIAEFRAAMENFAVSKVNLTWLAKGLLISHALMEHLAKDDMVYRDFLRSGA